MKQKKFSGIIVPAVTPLTSNFEIDKGAVEKIFNNFYQHNISPFILGTTGEAASLGLRQKKDYLDAAAQYKKDGTILYAGISSNVLSESIEFANLCAERKIDAVAATLPSYYSLSETQQQYYFQKLADSIPLPLIIYNIPATTHMSISLKVIDELSHHANIVATKDSERSEERLQESLKLWRDREDFGHFLGWAAKSAEALTTGSDGLIPSTGNLVPWIYEKMWKAAEQGNGEVLQEMQKLSDDYGSLYQSGKTLGESLWALKVLMRSEGLCDQYVMPPLQAMGEDERIDLLASYQSIKK